MKVAVDKTRRYQVAIGIDDFRRLRRDAGGHRDDAAIPAGDVLELLFSVKASPAYDQVKHGFLPVVPAIIT
jgi:hypothetical protein